MLSYFLSEGFTISKRIMDNKGTDIQGLCSEIEYLKSKVKLWENTAQECFDRISILHSEKELHRKLLNSIQHLVIALSENMTIQFCNNSYSDFVGIPVSKLEGKPLLELFPDLADSKTYKTYRKVIRTGKTVEMEGKTRNLYIKSSIFRTPDGILAIAEDVTAKKEAEKELARAHEALARSMKKKTSDLKVTQSALQHSEGQLNSILTSMDDTVFVFNEEGKFNTYHCPDESRLLTPPAQFIEKKHTQVMPPFLSELYSKAFDENKAGKSSEFEYELDYGDHTRWFSARVSPITSFDEYHGSVAVVRDITTKKEAEDKLFRSFEKLQQAMKGTISAMAKVVEIRDPYTAGHQERVANLAHAIALEMELDSERALGVFMAATIHDIGKIAVPSEILSKPTTLSAVEFSIIKTHPSVGYDILKSIDFPWPIADIVHQHHEHLDGTGYPNGTKTEEILLESKIMAVADVVESMASHRPYRPAKGLEMALGEITEFSGSHFDSQVVKSCLKLFNEKNYKLESISWTGKLSAV